MNRFKKYLYAFWMILKSKFREPKFEGKVFVIGYLKTGTTSVGRAVSMLGYNHTSFNIIAWDHWFKNDRVDKILNYTARYDSTDDLPWLKEEMIPILDKAFPNSKFIYLEREAKSWKKSYSTWFHNQNKYYPDKEEKYLGYKQHKEFVTEYFADKEDKLITLNVRDDEGYEKLASFLGKETSQKKFPHINMTDYSNP